MYLHRKPLPVPEAVARVMEYAWNGPSEIVPIGSCDGRILAVDVEATHPVPPFDKSPYDGFALKAGDTEGLSKDHPGNFHVLETIGAGARASRALREGEAVRIMTGAEMPEGADCVAMFEICHTYEEAGKDWVTLKRPMQAGQNVIGKGTETESGRVLVEKGTPINPGVKALLATFGYSDIRVHKKPRIGVFATGTELLEVDEALVPGKIRNSNAQMVLSQIKRAGGEGVYLGKLADEFEVCYQAVSRAMKDFDFLMTTGGVSVGDYDLMPAIYEKLEADVLFNKVAMRPGSVTTVAVKDGTLLYGLSGNPSACYVGFELFAYPVIQSFLGREKPYHPSIQAVLGEDFKKPNPFARFVRGFLAYEEGRVLVYPAGVDKSAVVTSLAHTNVLIVLKGGTRGYQKGDTVQAILLESPGSQPHFQ